MPRASRTWLRCVFLSLFSLITTVSYAGPVSGSISGTVTVAGTADPIPGAAVSIYDSSGASVAYVVTGPDGRFVAAGLEPGTYHALTSNSDGFVNVAFGGAVCLGCQPASSAPIVVNEAAETTNVDFALSRGGRVSGRVVAAATGAPLQGIPILVSDGMGAAAFVATTDADGRYTSGAGLPSGTYGLRTFNSGGYIDKRHPDTSCATGCSVWLPPSVVVISPDTTSDINFALDESAAVAGRVLAEATGQPLAAVRVVVLDANGTIVYGGAATNASGEYRVDTNVPSGSVLVRTQESGYLDEVYDNVPCSIHCLDAYAVATRVPVTEGQTTGSIDFALRQGATLSGTVTSGGQPLAGVNVRLGGAPPMPTFEAPTDALGRYTITGIAAGSYHLVTSTVDYVDKAWPNLTCAHYCGAADGDVVIIAEGDARAGYDFDLVKGGTIQGTVTAPGAPWLGVTSRGTLNPMFGIGAMVGADGTYAIRKLPPDTYKVFVNGAGDYIGEVYDNVQCANNDCWMQANTSGTAIVLGPGTVASGIDFALSTGGSISGTVTDAATNQPIAGVTVMVAMARSVVTDTQGNYTVTGLATGQYRLGTYNDAGYIDEEYDNVPCPGPCTYTQGVAVAVTAGVATTGVNFALTRGATLSGTITSNGVPLANISISLQKPDPMGGGAWTTTDALGNYTLRKITAGSYYLRTSSSEYIDEAYPNVPCLPWCSSTDGAPVVVAAGADMTGYNFDLARGGLIQGSVTAAGQPITQMMSVTALNTTIGKAFYSTMDPMMDPNRYSIRKLPAGTYKVFVSSGNGYIGELYDNVACPTGNCQSDAATAGTPVALAEGETRANVNFDLSTGGTLSGLVTGNGVPLASVNVYLQQLNGTAGAWATTGVDGRYTLRGVVPGSYSLRTSGTMGYVDELWNNVPCPLGCSLNIGTPVSVVGTGDLTGYDFDLARAAIVEGTVTGPSGAMPAMTSVTLYAAPSTYYSTSVGPTGSFTFPAVAQGTYTAYTWNNDGYIDEVFDNIPCGSSCTSTPGATPVVLVAGESRTIHFALSLGGKISGTVRGDGVPLSGINVQVNGPRNFSAMTDAQGRFEVKGLPDGVYKAYTTGNGTFIGEVYANRQCALSYCDSSAGDPIVIAGGSTAPAIDFDLARGAVVSGTVMAAGGGGIAGATVTVHDRDGFQMRSAQSGPNGSYTLGGLAAGTVYVRVTAPSYIDQVYSGIDCIGGCRVINGTPIVLAEAGQAQANFTLNPAARISGRIRSATTQVGISQVYVTAVRADGSFAGSATTNNAGDYTVNGLATGTYYLRTSGPHGFINQMYGGVPCPFSCSPTSGTPIDIVAGQTAFGKDFDLQPGLRIRGKVLDETTGQPVSALVSVMTATNYTAGSTSTAGDGTYESVGLPPGTYYVRAQSNVGHVPESYGGTVCLGSCWGVGTPVLIAGTDVENIDFALAKGGTISGTITDAATNNGVLSVNVTIVDAAGIYVTNAVSGPGGAFKTTTGLPSGTYYARAGSSGGSYVTRWYGGAECVGSCNNFTGATPIVVTSPNETPGIAIALRRGGAIAGRVVDTEGNPVTSGSAMVYTTSGTFAASAMFDSTGGYKTPFSLPEGAYHVTAGGARMVREVYGSGAPCLFNCPLSSGTPVQVTVDSVTGGIDFTLAPGGVVKGRVVSASSGQPVPYVNVFLLDGTGKRVTKANGTVDGLFQIGAGLPPGNYYLQTSVEDYVPTLHNGTQCLANCDPTAVAPAIVIAGSETVEFEIAIEKGGRIAGTVLSSSGSPIPGGVQVLDVAGGVVLAANANATGSFQSSDALPSGQYRVRSFNAAGHLNELYDNVPCTGDCTAGGALVTVTAGAVTSGLDFILDPDVDADDDGIADTIDANKVTAADERAIPSSDFTDASRGGTTAGTIADRGGWTVTARDVSPSGVQLSAAGTGTAPAAFDICDASGTERVLLDADTERANVTCSAAGSATVVAVRALPYVELRKPATGAGAVVMIGTGQGASLGSPVVADPANTQPILIRYVGDLGETLGVAILEAGESVDATVSPAGTIEIKVVTGAVEFARPGGSSELMPAGAHEILEFVPLDNLAPVIRSVKATPDVLLVPNHKLVPVTIVVDAADAVDPAPVCAIESVGSSEPDNGTGDGDTAIDWVRGTGLQLQLRAERSGNGPGRTYTVGIVCRDAIGNESRGAAYVIVPKGR